MTRVLRVYPCAYYAWRKRPLSPRGQGLTAQIQVAYRESRGTYGAPRIHGDLAAQGIRIGRKPVARLMRPAALHGVSRRKQFWMFYVVKAANTSRGPLAAGVERPVPAPGWAASATCTPRALRELLRHDRV
jgi:putative transposase